jgi:putative SOS response-associated peptidase YedK
MCGRFALGVDANELQDQLARQYFGRAEPGADQDDQGTGGSPSTEDTSPSVQPSGSSLVGRIAAEQAAEDSDEGEGELAYAGGPKELRWGSQENQSRWRPRYNVAPKSGGVVVRRSKSGAYELAVLKWGLV